MKPLLMVALISVVFCVPSGFNEESKVGIEELPKVGLNRTAQYSDINRPQSTQVVFAVERSGFDEQRELSKADWSIPKIEQVESLTKNQSLKPHEDLLGQGYDTKSMVREIFSYHYAIDIERPLTQEMFTCIRNTGYMAVFVRVYQPNGNGIVDASGADNVRNAFGSGLGVEIYVSPQPQGTKQGDQQFDETYAFLTNNGINVNAIWLQVTSPINWPNNQQANIAFISNFLGRARQYGLRVGIYTNWYDWQQITANWSSWSAQGSLMFWYWNAYGKGPLAASPNNFQDFRPFGGFRSVAVKQYAQGINVCGALVNQNVFVSETQSASSMVVRKLEESNTVNVGFIELPLN